MRLAAGQTWQLIQKVSEVAQAYRKLHHLLKPLELEKPGEDSTVDQDQSTPVYE